MPDVVDMIKTADGLRNLPPGFFYWIIITSAEIDIPRNYVMEYSSVAAGSESAVNEIEVLSGWTIKNVTGYEKAILKVGNYTYTLTLVKSREGQYLLIQQRSS